MPIPFLLPVAGAMAGAALGGANSILPSRAERENRKRIKEMEEAALGLTPAERKALEAQYAGTMGASQKAAERTASSLAAAGQAGSGAAMARQGQAYDAAISQGREIAADMLAANESKKATQKQEIADRKDIAATYASNRRQALADIGSAGIEAYQSQRGNKELVMAPKSDATSSLVKQIADMSDDVWKQTREKLVARGVTPAQIAELEAARDDATLNGGI